MAEAFGPQTETGKGHMQQEADVLTRADQRPASSSRCIHHGRTWGGPDAATVEVLTLRKKRGFLKAPKVDHVL